MRIYRLVRYSREALLSQIGELQDISNILLYTGHLDPQLKGTAALLIGNLINSTLLQCRGRTSTWLGDSTAGTATALSIEEMVNSLLAILEDDSSVASRLSISAFKTCLGTLLNSTFSHLGLKVLLSLIQLKENPYWLVKVCEYRTTTTVNSTKKTLKFVFSCALLFSCVCTIHCYPLGGVT